MPLSCDNQAENHILNIGNVLGIDYAMHGLAVTPEGLFVCKG